MRSPATKEWVRKRLCELRSRVFSVPMIGNAISPVNPLRSVGLSCHPSQVGEFNEDYRKAGIVHAHHAADGTCVIESRKARNQVLKLRGLRDNDACYGDHSGN